MDVFNFSERVRKVLVMARRAPRKSWNSETLRLLGDAP